MNDLSGKEDTFNAHKTAHSLATFRIYACMITPWRQAPVSAALDMTRLVLANLCRRKETVDCVCTLRWRRRLLPSGRRRTGSPDARQPPRLPRSFGPGDPAVGQLATAVLRKNLSPKQRARGLQAAVRPGEHWGARRRAQWQEPGGSVRQAGACWGGKPGHGEHPPFITPLAVSSWNCCSAQSQGKHCLAPSTTTTTTGCGQRLPTPLVFFTLFKRKQKRIQTSDSHEVTTSPSAVTHSSRSMADVWVPPRRRLLLHTSDFPWRVLGGLD